MRVRARATVGLGACLLLAASPAHRHHAANPAPADATDEDDPPAALEKVHVVRPGETLGGIAARAHVPRVLIAEANGLKLPYRVHNGMRLTLPRTRHHIVVEGETGFDLAYRYGVPYPTIAVANGIKPSAVLHPGQKLLIPTVIGVKPAEPAYKPEDDTATPADAPVAARHFAWPVPGKVTRGFAPRGDADYHDGVDIAAPAGTAARAAGGGTVIFAGTEPQSFGRLVVIDHGDGWQSAYGFLARVTVAKGDVVKPHERIGLVGHSGKATGNELHFELRHGNKPVDPIPDLPPRAGSIPPSEADDAPAPKSRRHAPPVHQTPVHRKNQKHVPVDR